MALQSAETRGSSAPVLVAASLLALAGCNLQGRQPTPPQTAPSLGPAPQTLAPGRGFFLNQDRDTASLAYGRANSDDVDLMLQCQKGARDVQIIDAARVPERAKGAMVLTLISGAAASDLKAQISLDETGLTLASAHAPSDIAAFKGFRQTGALSVKLGGGIYALTATPAEMASVARFFAACERR